ncbi:MAG: hypothetical protein P8H61_10750, partial [Ilumatobacter sp.]|nr:hypothetical protein [Ilumatobacter sp.]
TALASIEDATATKPYVIKIAPGTYTENSNVAMKNYVDVEGSGQDVTTIKCACSNVSPDASSAVISAGAINAEIRHLTINNTSGGGSFGNGLFTESVTDGSFSMLHVTATATGGSDHNSGVLNYSSSSPTMNNVTAIAEAADGKRNYGVYNISSSPTMNNVTATATGTSYSYGVYNTGSSPTMNNVTATATGGTGSYGVYNEDSTVKIRNSSLTGTFSIQTDGQQTAYLAHTTLDGTVGPVTECFGVYNASFVEINC